MIPKKSPPAVITVPTYKKNQLQGQTVVPKQSLKSNLKKAPVLRVNPNGKPLNQNAATNTANRVEVNEDNMVDPNKNMPAEAEQAAVTDFHCGPQMISPCNASCNNLFTIESEDVRRDLFGDQAIVETANGHQKWLVPVCQSALGNISFYRLEEETCKISCLGSGHAVSYRQDQNNFCLNSDWSLCNTRCVQSRAVFGMWERDCSGGRNNEIQERSCSSFNCPVDVGDYLVFVDIRFMEQMGWIFSNKQTYLSTLQLNQLLSGLESMLKIKTSNMHTETTAGPNAVKIVIRVNNRGMWIGGLQHQPWTSLMKKSKLDIATFLAREMTDGEFLLKFGGHVNSVNVSGSARWFLPANALVEKIVIKEVKRNGIAVYKTVDLTNRPPPAFQALQSSIISSLVDGSRTKSRPRSGSNSFGFGFGQSFQIKSFLPQGGIGLMGFDGSTMGLSSVGMPALTLASFIALLLLLFFARGKCCGQQCCYGQQQQQQRDVRHNYRRLTGRR